MADDVNAWISGGIALVTGAISSFVTYAVTRRPVAQTAAAAELTAEAAWETAMNTRFTQLMEQSAKLEAERQKSQEEHEGRLAAYILQLESAVTGMSQHLVDLEEALRQSGLTVPVRPAHAWPPAGFHVIQGGKK